MPHIYKQAITHFMLLPTVQIYIALYELPLICIHWLSSCEQTGHCALDLSQIYFWQHTQSYHYNIYKVGKKYTQRGMIVHPLLYSGALAL